MNEITSLQTYIFTGTVLVLYILNICLLIGLSTKAVDYINTIDYYIKIYVSLYIIYRFNQFRKVSFTELDRKIIFTSGIFLFTTTIIHTILIKFITQIKTWIEPYVKKITG